MKTYIQIGIQLQSYWIDFGNCCTIVILDQIWIAIAITNYSITINIKIKILTENAYKFVTKNYSCEK